MNLVASCISINFKANHLLNLTTRLSSWFCIFVLRVVNSNFILLYIRDLKDSMLCLKRYCYIC